MHFAVKLGGRGLIETAGFLQAENADGLEDAQRAEPVGIGGIFRRLETDEHVTLRGEIIDLVGLHLLDQADEIGRIRDVAIMQKEAQVRHMRIAVEMIDAIRIDERRPPLHAMDDIAFLDEQFGQIGAILAGDAGNQCDFRIAHSVLYPYRVRNRVA